MMEDAAARWRSPARETLLWHDWEGQVVVRYEGSGCTHLLSVLGSRVLLALLACPAGVVLSDLAKHLSDLFDDEEHALTTLEGVLLEFEKLGLAERAHA